MTSRCQTSFNTSQRLQPASPHRPAVAQAHGHTGDNLGRVLGGSRALKENEAVNSNTVLNHRLNVTLSVAERLWFLLHVSFILAIKTIISLASWPFCEFTRINFAFFSSLSTNLNPQFNTAGARAFLDDLYFPEIDEDAAN